MPNYKADIATRDLEHAWGVCAACRRYDDVVAKLGGGTEAARSMGELLSGVGSQLASQSAIAEARTPLCLPLRALDVAVLCY